MTFDATRRLAVTCCLTVAAGCVSSGTHEATVDELNRTRGRMAQIEADLTLAKNQLTRERDGLAKKSQELDHTLTQTMEQNQQLVTKIATMGQNVENLLGQKDQLAEEREKLAKRVEELNRLRDSAEARNAEYRSLLDKLRQMIDAGTLEVKVRGGRMLVQMSSDVLFPPGGTKLKPEAQQAIAELAQSIKSFPGRKFQVMGHSDPTPINTARFPSNWELSTQRAIEVVKVMIEAGVPAEMISAAGAAEFDPLVPNDTPENMVANRRVELVFLPKIDELPGFEQVLTTVKAP